MGKVKEEKKEAEIKKSPLDLALEKLNKDYGKGTVMTSSFVPSVKDVISTGSLKLDIATGIGGLAAGKVTEIMGWESSGKSTICLYLIANTQKKGKKALLLDGEHSFDKSYAENLGVDTEQMIICQSEIMEEAYTVAMTLMDTKEFGIVIIDSQTALKPKKVVEGELGDSTVGTDSRMMGQVVLKMVNAAWRNNVAVVFISQYREKIGVMYGSPVTTSGGNALRFYTHMRIEVSKTVIKESDVAHHNKTKCLVKKNKLASPYGEAEFDIIFGEGIDRTGEIIDLAVDAGIVSKSGSWYAYGDTKLGQGADGVRRLFEDNPELMLEIEEKVKFKPKENTDEDKIEEIIRESGDTTVPDEGSSGV